MIFCIVVYRCISYWLPSLWRSILRQVSLSHLPQCPQAPLGMDGQSHHGKLALRAGPRVSQLRRSWMACLRPSQHRGRPKLGQRSKVVQFLRPSHQTHRHGLPNAPRWLWQTYRYWESLSFQNVVPNGPNTFHLHQICLNQRISKVLDVLGSEST